MSAKENRRRISARVKLIAARLFVAGGGVVAALLILEAGTRLFAPQQLILLRPDIWRGCPRLGWCMAPNVDTLVNTGEREVRLKTDEWGHRIGTGLRINDGLRVLALGDSFLAGIQVGYDDLMTAQLERGLSAALGRSVAVVNTGVGGWGPNHYLIKLRGELDRSRYDAVLVFLFLGNDIEEVRRDEFPVRSSAKRHRIRLPENFTRGELIDALAYPVNDTLERRSHLFILLKNRSWALLMRLGLSARRFPSVYLKSEENSARWQVTSEICTEIARAAKAKEIPILFVLLPGAYQVDQNLGAGYARAVGLTAGEVDLDQPAVIMNRLLSGDGLTVVDTTPALRAAHTSGVEGLFGRVDTHLGPAGHATVARTVEPVLRRRLVVGAGDG